MKIREREYSLELDADEQIESEEKIAAYLFDNHREGFSEEDAAEAGREILSLVLQKFRPDVCIQGELVMIEMLEPGNYSVFVLSDDQTWQQPTYRIVKPMSERDFRMAAEMDCDGFISFGVNEDTECPEENVRVFS